jgi:hypothetical protein
MSELGRELERIGRPRLPVTDAEALAGLVRVTAGVWYRTATWSVGASLRLARAAGNPGDAIQLATEVRDGVRGYLREFLGVEEPATLPAVGDAANGAGELAALRAAGAELLRLSADVTVDQTGHPAYARILEELAPDEARILRLFYLDGPQPSVDVRSSQLFGIGSVLVAEGLNMIGPQAGARHPGRVPAYLNNLYRLGLVWFSKEPLEDPIAYQVLEAQPTVLGAMKRSPRAKSVQRSILLTPFGRDFVEACLPIATVETGEVLQPQ